MKIIAVSSVLCAFVFVGVGVQLGAFPKHQDDEPAPVEQTPQAAPEATPVFPDDLAPSAQARPVAAAAAYQPSPSVHPMVFLRLNGAVHKNWQEALNEDWAADSVRMTELAIVVGVPKKAIVSHHTFTSSAPPITRYQHELEISVIEVKTGRILANRLFRNVPRPLERQEPSGTTSIGHTVTQRQVFNWVARMSKEGFTETARSNVIVTRAD